MMESRTALTTVINTGSTRARMALATFESKLTDPYISINAKRALIKDYASTTNPDDPYMAVVLRVCPVEGISLYKPEGNH